jgi:Helix-turn-helix domain
MPNCSGALDQVFQALANPTRRNLVERLIRGPASVSDLAQPLAMSLDGHEQPDWREHGTSEWLDALGAELKDRPSV